MSSLTEERRPLKPEFQTIALSLEEPTYLGLYKRYEDGDGSNNSESSGRASARDATQAREAFEPSLGLLIMRKPPLVQTKSARVIVAPPLDQSRRVFDVEHLVIKDVLHEPFRNFFRIQRLADRNAVVNVVMMAEDAARATLRPGHRRFRQLSVEVAAVQFRKHPFEIVNLAMRAEIILRPRPRRARSDDRITAGVNDSRDKRRS